MGDSWRAANQERRNTLAGTLFEEIKIDSGDKVVAVKPKAEFQAFFKLSYGRLAKDIGSDPGGGLGSNVQYTAYAIEALCHDIVERTVPKRKLPDSFLPTIIKEHETKSLRAIAKDCGVSYETIRRVMLQYSITHNNT